MKEFTLAFSLLFFAACSTNDKLQSIERSPQSFIANCKNLFNSLFQNKSHRFFNDIEMNQLQEAIKKWDRPAFTRLRNSPKIYAAVLMQETPEVIKKALLDLPLGNNKESYQYLNALSEAIPQGKNHLLKSYLTLFDKKIMFDFKTHQDVVNYFEELNSLYRATSQADIKIIQDEIQEVWKETIATEFFEKNFYVKLDIAFINGKQYLKIKEKQLLVKKVGENYQVKVPRDMVRIRGDNPLETKKLMQMASSPYLKSPRVYHGHINLNGHFLLDDGNHRFTARETRKEVWIDIGPKLETLSMNHHLIYSGSLTLNSEDLIKLYNDELSLFDILPPGIRNHLLWSEEELVKLPKPE